MYPTQDVQKRYLTEVSPGVYRTYRGLKIHGWIFRLGMGARSAENYEG
jgi:hypothetical protein